jgi:hypothetical protein
MSDTTKSDVLKWARFYVQQRWHVVPLHTIKDGKCSCGKSDCESPGKHPRTKHGFKDGSIDPAQITEWFERQWPESNIGIVTGSISNLTVLDADSEEGMKVLADLPRSKRVRTGKGEHLYLRYCPGLKTAVRFCDGIDVRSDGGYVVAPPSKHISGKVYEWVRPMGSFAGPEDPAIKEFLDRVAASKTVEKGKGTKAPLAELVKGAPEGERNATLTRLIGSLISKGHDEETILALAHSTGKTCDPPMDPREVEKIYESISKTHKRRHPAPPPVKPVLTPIAPLTATEFPDHVISGLAGDFTNLYSEHLEPPRLFWFFSFLTCLGSVFSPRVTLKSEIRPQPRLFTLLLGESGDDRKSTALNKTCNFFKSWLKRRDEKEHFNVCSGIGSAEGLQKRMEGERKNLLLCFDEFKQFISKCTVKSSILLEMVSSLFDNNHHEGGTKARLIALEDAHLSFLAASTHEIYQSLWINDFSDIGFGNRLFIVPGNSVRKIPFPEPVPNEKISHIQNQLGMMWLKYGPGTELDFNEEARSIYASWYISKSKTVFAKRLDNYCLRLSILLAINRFKDCVDKDIITDAISLCDWQLAVRKPYTPIVGHTEVAKMEEKIRRALATHGVLSWRELQQKTHAHRAGLEIFKKAIKNLLDAGEICLHEGKYALAESEGVVAFRRAFCMRPRRGKRTSGDGAKHHRRVKNRKRPV